MRAPHQSFNVLEAASHAEPRPRRTTAHVVARPERRAPSARVTRLRAAPHRRRHESSGSRLNARRLCCQCLVAAAGGAPSDTSVVVFSAVPYVREFLEGPLLEAFPRTRFVEARLSTSSVSLAQGADVACLFVNDDCGPEVCAALKAAGVRLIAMRCAGFDRVDVAAANALGITVLRVPSYSPHAVAEHSVALALCLNRSLHKAYARVREGNFTLNGLVGFNMHQKTVGIVGTGQIGTIAGSIYARGFGCRVLGYDLYPNNDFTAFGATYCNSLSDLMRQSDIISLHAPLNKSTLHLIGAEQIAQMKRGAFIINTSRGGLIDTRAVIDGLASGAVGALGMDVYEREGRLFFKDFSTMDRTRRMRDWDEQMAVLLSLPNVIVTPHSAFLTSEALANIAATTVANISAFVQGEELVNIVRPA